MTLPEVATLKEEAVEKSATLEEMEEIPFTPVTKSKKTIQKERRMEELRNKEETLKSQEVEKKRKSARQTPDKSEGQDDDDEDEDVEEDHGHTQITRL